MPCFPLAVPKPPKTTKAMTLNEYQEKAMMTNAASSDNDTYSLFGLMAEVGELADKVAKGVRKEMIEFSDNNIYMQAGETGNKELVEGIKKELGDVLWFVSHFAQRFGWSLEEVAQLNLDKLADRAKRGVIIGDGDNR